MQMQVRRFLDKLAEGTPPERAGIVESLVQVYLNAALDAETKAAAVTAMTLILDDPAPRVRRALAEGLADSCRAPRAIVMSLAQDQADIAEIVLARSPVLSEADLIDLAGGAGERQRRAIAARPFVPVGVAAAIVEVSDGQTCRALITNPGAELTPFAFRRVVARHRKDAGVRSALLERDDLPVWLRDELIAGLSEALGDLVRERRWMSGEKTERMLGEARERSVVELAAGTSPDQLRTLIERLHCEGRLTPALIIRAACAGDLRFFEEALSALSGTPCRRVSALVRNGRGPGFAALLRRTGLPAAAAPVFGTLVETIQALPAAGRRQDDTACRAGLVERAAALHRRRHPDLADPYSGLLARLASEEWRAAARAETGGYFRAA